MVVGSILSREQCWPSCHSGAEHSGSNPEMGTTFKAQHLVAHIYPLGTVFQRFHSMSRQHHQLEPIVPIHELVRETFHIQAIKRRDWRMRFATPRTQDTAETREEPGSALGQHLGSALGSAPGQNLGLAPGHHLYTWMTLSAGPQMLATF